MILLVVDYYIVLCYITIIIITQEAAEAKASQRKPEVHCLRGRLEAVAQKLQADNPEASGRHLRAAAPAQKAWAHADENSAGVLNASLPGLHTPR